MIETNKTIEELAELVQELVYFSKDISVGDSIRKKALKYLRDNKLIQVKNTIPKRLRRIDDYMDSMSAE